METVVFVIIGIALAACCGFRVFVPLLAMSLAVYLGYFELAPDFAWIGSLPALITFSVATVLEIAAYYIPWVDNALDTIATPTAVIAGTIVAASFITDIHPVLRWSTAIIAGGGSAGLIQGSSVLLRGLSTTLTGGITNFVVSTLENVASIIFSVLAILLPVFTIMVLVVIGGFTAYKIFSNRAKAAQQN